MYSLYIPRDRWPSQLLDAIISENDLDVDSREAVFAANSQEDSQSLRVADLVATETAAAQALSIL